MFFLSAEDIIEEKNIFPKCEVIKSHSQLNSQSGSWLRKAFNLS